MKLDPPLWQILAVMAGSALLAIACGVPLSLWLFP
jgi:hypothetical protein